MMRTDALSVFGRDGVEPIHPLHAILLSFAFPLFLGALVSDWAYWRTYQIQWSNFAAWLIAGGLLVSAFAALWAIVAAIRDRGGRLLRTLVYLALLVVMWVLGFINALVHSKDAWAVMPEGLVLSILTALLALAASWVGFSGLRAREVN